MLKYTYLVVVCCGLLACEKPAIQIEEGKSRTIYPDMIGLNGNLTSMDQPWNHDGFVSAVESIGTTNFRYPAGTLGNYWDWDKGWLDASVPDSAMIKWVVENNIHTSDYRYTLENLAEGYRKTGFTPVFMLNMLSKDLAHSVRNLLRARDLGLPVKYIELGNELYFNLPYEMSVYPTPEDYGKTCQVWIDSLKVHFPEAKYALLGGYIKRRPRHTNWTQRALKYCTNADAITFHKYSPAGIDGRIEQKDITAGTEGTADLSTVTRTPPSGGLAAIQEWEVGLLQNDSTYANFLATARDAALYYQKINAPEGMEIWVTEFNMRDDMSGLRGTWANAFYDAKYYEVFMNSPVTITNIHNVIGSKFAQIFSSSDLMDFIKWKEVEAKPWALSSQGIATAAFAKATAGMTTSTKLEFSDDQELVNDLGATINTLAGWKFSTPDSAKLLLINYGRTPQTVRWDHLEDFSSALSYSAPAEAYITDGFADLLIEESLVGSSLILPPFSFTLVK
ncbi:hypothetical protein N7E81_08010 [Reichenbachiella carrageenanivorans]|uniref:Alpha-L-arabinofuranosidase n=1 Tax=Reichenbachiella carrageenanivorans TaxID=2979869 RepID=A0ABY6D4G2_9BACT|nr:hypothetical protein [Reichenbachiella carrageenanivorans]UXX81042.1 hypothetical protein N7E81_08010 [Reichenbachiella carrageenanivorans]